MSDERLARLDGFLRRRRGPVGWALFGITLAILVATLDDPGITWDEPSYFASAQLQVRWVETLLAEGPAAALDRDVVWGMWDWDHYHNPHPPLYKEGMAATWWATKDLLGPVASFRLYPAILFAGLVMLLFRWGCAAWGGIGGIGAALSVALMPRLIGHAHIGATETPLLVFWTATAAAVWWAVERDDRWGWVAAGLFWGLAAGTKFTGLAALIVPGAWALWKRPARSFAGLTIAALTGAAIFAALNPLIWTDAPEFFGTWFWESLHREEYVPISTYYLGRTWGFDMPWHHAPVLTVAVVPLGILALAGTGLFVGARRRDDVVLISLGTIVFVWTIMMTPEAPHHNGVRQFIELFPFVALAAGYGLHRASRSLGVGRTAVVGLLAFAPAAVQAAWIHPYYLSYYGEAVGGVRGAADLGFETTYWMDVVNEDVYEWMNDSLPNGARVMVLGPTLVLERAQTYGWVRRDLEFTSDTDAEFYLIPMNQFLMSPLVERAVSEAEPIYSRDLAGVRLVAIYHLGPER